MAITQEEAQALVKKFEILPLGWEVSKEQGQAVWEAWQELMALMERENNFSDHLGIREMDWQINNWAYDMMDALNNSRLYDEGIRLCEDILKIDFGDLTKENHENAWREMADLYERKGEPQTGLKLYADKLAEDSLWGWGWIGYCRMLKEHDPEKYQEVVKELDARLINETFRDQEDLEGELRGEGVELKKDALFSPGKKIYPNDPCPCGSGLKYKKCHGKKH